MQHSANEPAKCYTGLVKARLFPTLAACQAVLALQCTKELAAQNLEITSLAQQLDALSTLHIPCKSRDTIPRKPAAHRCSYIRWRCRNGVPGEATH